MNIRPMDLQVMMPRTLEAARVAAVSDQQSVLQQQQLAEQMKQAAAEQQKQVQHAMPAQPEGRVSMEDLPREKQEQQKKKQTSQTASEEPDLLQTTAEQAISLPIPPDPIRGGKIDIKT